MTSHRISFTFEELDALCNAVVYSPDGKEQECPPDILDRVIKKVDDAHEKACEARLSHLK